MHTTRPLVLGLAQTLLAAIAFILAGRAIDADAGTTALVAAAGIAAALTAALAWFSTTRASRDQVGLESLQRRSIVDHILRIGPVSRSRDEAGRLVSTATDAVERHNQYRATFFGSMIGSLLAPLLVVVVIAVAIDWRIALWLLAAMPAVPLMIGSFQRVFASVSARYRASARGFASLFLDSLQGLPTLRALGAGRRRAQVLADGAEDVRRHVMRLLAGNQLVLLVADAVFSLAMIVLATALATQGLSSGTLTVGSAVAVVLLSTLMTEPLERIGQFFYIGMGGIASGKEIRAVLASGVDSGYGPDSADEPAVSDGSIRMENVTFSYGQDGPHVLDDFSVTVTTGERVVMQGRSGVGKTTALSLIQGYRKPDAGHVYVGGHALTDVPSAWLHRQIGVVAQGTYLFTGTLRENLLLARPGSSEDQLWEALRRAQLDTEVRSWPDGLDTPVGERGMTLSGGQSQRVAIARALLADAPILILDEATSQTDVASEREILTAIAEVCRDRTVLAVGHREATIAAATRVVTMGDAR